MAKIFPKVTKCTFHKYGPSGTVMKLDALCVLPLNIINEKIFIFLWFWLIFLALVTGLYLIFRIWTFLRKQFRVRLIVIDGGRSCRRAHIEAFLEPEHLSWCEKMGDWFLLHLICKNLNVLLVNDLINQLCPIEDASDFSTETLSHYQTQIWLTYDLLSNFSVTVWFIQLSNCTQRFFLNLVSKIINKFSFCTGL